MADKEIAVKVQDLTKTFKIPLEASSGIKQKLINTLKGRKGYREFTPLNDVSFEIEKGDFFGIVGRNGSGKSTLLKTIAGIYAPEKGLVQVNGKLVPFIELGVGFNPELTGRENVFLNGALLGFSRKEMEAMYDKIVEFAELEEFMDERLKNYSSGMQVRLAFSIAIRAEGDVLLLDEVLAVGDEAFQRKCYEYFDTLKRNKKTVIIVTHDMSAVEKFCNKAILIEKGQLLESGSVQTITNTYRDLLSPEPVNNEIEDSPKDNNRWGDKSYVFTKPHVVIDDINELNRPIKIETSVKCNTIVKKDHLVAYAVKDSLGQVLFGGKLKTNKLATAKKGDEKKVTFTFPNILSPGKYFIDLSIFSDANSTYSDMWLDCAEFTVKTEGGTGFTLIVSDNIEIAK